MCNLDNKKMTNEDIIRAYIESSHCLRYHNFKVKEGILYFEEYDSFNNRYNSRALSALKDVDADKIIEILKWNRLEKKMRGEK